MKLVTLSEHEKVNLRLAAELAEAKAEVIKAWSRYKNANDLSVSFQMERADLAEENAKLKARVAELEASLQKPSAADILARIKVEPGYAMSLLQSAGILDASGNLTPPYRDDKED